MVTNPFSDGIAVEVGGDASGLTNAVSTAVASLGRLAKTAGIASAAVGAIGAVGIAKSVSSFADFDAAMTESLAIMGDVSAAMEEDMADAAQTVAQETRFSAEEAAESYFFLASAGLDAQESIEALPEVSEFAQAGMFDMAEATDILTDAQSALGLETEELGSLSDQLVTANTLANASVEQFGQSLTNKAAPAMRRLGVQTEEGIAALSVFADQGLKGRRAGTILARSLDGLSTNARENQEAFEELGVEVFDADGEMRSMQDIIADLEDGLEGMSTEQRQAALSQLGFNRRAQQGLDLLTGNSDELGEYQDELEDAGGTAEEVADKQLDTLNAQWDLMTDKLNVLAIEIGEKFKAPVRDAIGVLNDGIGRITDFVESVEGVRDALGLGEGSLVSLKTAFAVLTGPIGTAISLIWRFRDQIGEAITTIREDVIEPFIDGFSEAFDADIGDVIDETVDTFEEFQDLSEDVFSDAGDAIDDLLEPLGGLEGAAETAGRLVGDAFEDISDAIIAVNDIIQGDRGLGGAESTIADFESSVTDIFGNVQEIVEDFIDTGQRIWTDIQPALDDLSSAIEDSGPEMVEIFDSILDAVKGFTDFLNDDVQPVVSAVLEDFVVPLFNDMAAVVAEDLEPTLDEVSDTIDALTGHAEDFHDDLETAWNHIDDIVLPVTETLADVLHDSLVLALESAFDAANLLMNLIQGDFDEALKDAKDLVGDIFGAVKSTIGDVVTWLINDAPGILASAVGTAVDELINAFIGFGEWLIGGSKIPEIFNDVASWILGSAPGILKSAAKHLIRVALEAPFRALDLVTDLLGDAVSGAADWLENRAEDLIIGPARSLARSIESAFDNSMDLEGMVRSEIRSARQVINRNAEAIAAAMPATSAADLREQVGLSGSGPTAAGQAASNTRAAQAAAMAKSSGGKEVKNTKIDIQVDGSESPGMTARAIKEELVSHGF